MVGVLLFKLALLACLWCLGSMQVLRAGLLVFCRICLRVGGFLVRCVGFVS